MAVTRIKNNQIFDAAITAQKIAAGTLVGSLFNPNLTLNSNVTISGNLSVLGGISTISSTNTFVNDPLVVFNNGYVGAPAYDVGILVNRNLNPINTALVWNEASQAFMSVFTTETGGSAGTIDKTGFAGFKAGTMEATGNLTVASTVRISDGSIQTLTGDLALTAAGGDIFTSGRIVPVNAGDTVGLVGTPFANVFTSNLTIGGATATVTGGNLVITPPTSGQTVIANLVVTGTSTVSGDVVSSNATITGGTINGTTIGATTPSTGVFSSIVDTGAFTANGEDAAISLAPTGTGTVTINPATAGSISNMSGSFTTLTSSGTTGLADTTATSLSTANAVVTGGSISGTPVSGSTGSFTTLDASGAVSATGNAAVTLSPTGTLGTVTINPAVAGSISNMAGSFTTLSASGTTTLADMTSTGITNTPIGSTNPSTGAFTTASATTLTATNGTVTNLSTGNAQVTGGNIAGVGITTSPISGSTGSFTTLTASAGANLAPTTGTVTVNPTTAGAIDNMVIGANTPKAATFTSISGSSLSVPAINSTPIGNATPSTGTFTDLAATVSANLTTSGTVIINPATAGTMTNVAVSGSTGSFTTMTTSNAQVTGGNITGTPVSGSTGSFTTLTSAGATTLSPTTGTVTVNPTNVGAMDNVTIGATTARAGTFTTLTTTNAVVTGGNIDATPIGNATPSTGAFTTLSASSGITGTISTASQTNITTVGTLTDLAVTGNATVGGNDVLTSVSAAGGDVSGNLSAIVLNTVNSNVGTFSGITVNAKGLVTAAEALTTLAGYGITDAAPLSHASDMGMHLTTDQNTFLDAVTVTSAEVNRLAGVTSGVQGQIDAKLALAGGTMLGDINIPTGVKINLTDLPSSAAHAVNKSYVDALVSSSTTWRAPVASPTLIDIVAAAPATPTSRVAYIASAASTWGGSTAVAIDDIVEYDIDNSVWVVIDQLAAGKRFIVAGEGGSVGTNLFAAGARTIDLIEWSGSAWTLPEADSNQAVEFSAHKASTDATGLLSDSTVYTASVSVNGTPNVISIVGSAAQTFADLFTEINADLTGATASMVAGHIHITGANATDTILITDTDLFSSMTGYVDIRGSAKPGTTVLCNSILSGDNGHTYLFSGGDDGDHAWTEIGGPGSIGAGVGLAYSGSTLNVNMGAGITELPGDEVGIAVQSDGGLWLTSGAMLAPDVTSAGRIALKLDGTTLQTSANGTKVAPGQITNTELNTVNSNVGSFGSNLSVGTFTVNGVGRVTAAANVAIAFPVTSVAAKTGAVTLVQADIGGLTTASSPTFAGVSTANAVVTGGSINGTAIGNATPNTGAFTTLSANSLTLAAINGTIIGNATPASGKFTTLESTGLATLASAGVTGALTAGSMSTANAVVTGGTVDGTVIGGTTAAAGTFSDLVATISVNLTTSGTVTINPTTAGSIANMAGSFTTLGASGTTTLAGMTSTGITASPISGSTGSFTTLASSGATTMTATTASTSTTSGAVIVTGGVGIGGNLHVGGTTTMAAASATSATVTGDLTANGLDAAISLAPTGLGTVTVNPNTAGALDNMVIGATTAKAGTFSVMNTANAQVTGGNITSTTISGSTGSFTTLSASQGVTLSPTSGTVTVYPTNVGALDNVNIGANTAGTGAFTTLSANSLTLAAINGTVIGNATPSTGAFTTLSASGGITGTLSTAAQPNVTSVGTLTGLTVSGTSTLAVTTATDFTATGNVDLNGASKTISIAPTGTGTVTINPNTAGLMTNVVVGSASLRQNGFFDAMNATTGTFGTSVGTGTLSTTGLATLASASVTAGLTAGSVTTANAVVTGGTINGTSIGAGTAASGAFTTLAASGASTLTGAVSIDSTVVSTSTTTGALKVAGGVGIVGNVNVGKGATINASQSAIDTIVKGVNDVSLLFASSSTDQVMIGGAVTSSAGFTAGVKLHVNSTDSMITPKGTLGERPATAVAGMMRYNTTYNTLEFYNGTGWQSTATVFTIITDEQFAGTGSQTVFTLSAAATTAGAIVTLNGVVQLPGTAYSISTTTLTFTEAPADGDTIGVRALTTTTEMVGLASSNGQCTVSADNAGVHISTGTTSSTERMMIAADGTIHVKAGSVQTYDQTAISVGTSATVIASFDKTAYRTGKFVVQVTNSGSTEFESTEVLVLHDGTTAYSAEYAGIFTGAAFLGEITVAVNGANVELMYTGAAAGNLVKVKQELVAV